MIYFLIITIASILYTIITWRNISHGLFLLAALLPTYLLRFEVGPVPMTMLEVFILIFFVLSLRGAKRRGNLRELLYSVRHDRFLIPICLLLLAASISVFIAPDKLSALGIWKAYFVEPILLFLIIRHLIESRETTQSLLIGLATGGLFIAIFAIIQKLTGLGIPIPWDVEGRVTSVFPYPNAVGLYLGPVIVIGIILSLRATKERDDIFWILTATLSTIAIILSKSEAAIVAVLATLFIAAVMTKKLRKITITITAVTIIAIALSPFRQTIFDKLTLNDYSGQVRRSQWRETITMLKEQPVFGAGLNGYPKAMEKFHADTQYEIFQYPHNILLNIWSELGLLGLVAFAWLAWYVIKTYSTTALLREPPPAFFALLVMTIHGLADVPYFKNDLAVMTWMLIAIIASTAYAKPTEISSQRLDA